MKDFLKRVWRRGRWALLALVVAYLALVGIGTYDLENKQKSADAVAAIHARKVTVADATWKNLPEAPDPTLDDSTVEGIDTNGNGVRDEVELTIYLWHKDSARIRAAELQYAQALQSDLTLVFDSPTWVAAAQEETRGYLCMRVDAKLLTQETGRIEKLVLDTDLRRQKYKDINRYEVSYGDLSEPNCDIDLQSLPN